MKQIDPGPEVPNDEDETTELAGSDRDTEDFPGEVFTARRATWREIEKRRELLDLSRLIDESIDDHIFND